ncbi:Uncharacterised protein [uncultured archaeon]|nr:Uncharacterised protein [uncultured archaeon]
MPRLLDPDDWRILFRWSYYPKTGRSDEYTREVRAAVNAFCQSNGAEIRQTNIETTMPWPAVFEDLRRFGQATTKEQTTLFEIIPKKKI